MVRHNTAITVFYITILNHPLEYHHMFLDIFTS